MIAWPTFQTYWAWSFQEDGTRNIKRFRRAWNARLATCGQAFKMIFYETWPRVATSLDEIHVETAIFMKSHFKK
jgi:hypothetical protein